MKICARHFSDLSEQVKHKGMGSMIRPERSELFAQQWLAGHARVHEFDPLVVAALEVNKKATELCGAAIINGSCPLCTVTKVLQNHTADQTWIDNVTDCMLLFAKVNNLVH